MHPAVYYVLETLREKRACARCEELGVSVAPVPASIVEKVILGDGLVIDVILRKFADHTPLYRQAAAIEARAGEKVVRVGFSNSYRGSDDDVPILRVVGEQGAQFFKQSFELKIKGDLIPESAVESVIGELQEIFARHGAGAALSAKAVFKPTKDFHTARHTLFSAKQNLEIDKVVPVSASVKTKLGRGGSYED